MWATSIGSTFAHRPVPGVRKSGIPDGTEIPAPVSATTLSAAWIIAASRSVRVPTALTRTVSLETARGGDSTAAAAWE